MILPTNGRVIIIDDEPKQALPLISVLSKFNTPCSYFDAKKDSLPDRKFSDVRILFLDINLNGGQQPNWSIEKGILINNISGVIEPHIPYILFVWSLNETEHFDDLKELFDTELIDYKPIIAPIKMDKTSLFKQEVDDDSNVKWELTQSAEETIKIIKTKIDEGLSTIDSFEALLSWENIVNDSSSLVVNDIVKLAAYDKNVTEGLKQIYLSLAHAYWGKTLEPWPNETIISKSLINLNHLLSDKIEFKINTDLSLSPLASFPTTREASIEFRAELNSRLLITDDIINTSQPGNLYIRQTPDFKKSIVEDLIDRSTFSGDFCADKKIELKDLYEGLEIKKQYKRDFNSFGFRQIEEIVQKAISIQIELTPICDYSQNNRKFCRVVLGVIMDAIYMKNRKRSADYYYLSPVFMFNEKPVNFYCDFRYVLSLDPKELEGIKPDKRIRHLFQAEIQSHFARQVSRPGLVSL